MSDARPINVDLFAGGGGASTGFRLAIGRDPDVAVNHDPKAIAMHKANHPDTLHVCQDVWSCPAQWATKGRPVALLHASPDCTHFSKAKGGAPKRDQKRRDLAWVIVKWAREVRPNLITMENVEEIKTWGPLDHEGHPIASQAGTSWRSFIAALKRLGNAVQWRELLACDYGAPTIRKRLFLIARRDGKPIVWPEPTHGPGRPLPFRTAAECIDWSIPCPSIFDRKRPLAENTLRRIAIGIQRYVLNAAQPFVVNLTHGGRLEDINDPIKTITAAHRGEKALVTPFLTEHANASGQRTFDVQEPLRTQCAQVKGGHFAMVSPVLVTNTSGHAPGRVDAPVSTLTTGGQQMLTAPLLVGAGGPAYGGKPVQADKPFGTLMTENHTALVAAFLAKHYGGVVGHGPTQPIGSVTTVDHHSLVAAHITKFYGSSTGSCLDEPLHTVTAGGHAQRASTGYKHGLIAAHLQRDFGNSVGQAADAPLGTVTAGGGGKAGLVATFLTKYYGQGVGQAMSAPAATVTTRDRMGLVTVTIEGQPYVIADIGMRMLQPRELYRAQGFPDSYIIGDDPAQGLSLTKAEQVHLCGNSVCPDVLAAILRANYTEDFAHEPARELPLLAGEGRS